MHLSVKSILLGRGGGVEFTNFCVCNVLLEKKHSFLLCTYFLKCINITVKWKLGCVVKSIKRKFKTGFMQSASASYFYWYGLLKDVMFQV